MYVMYSMVLTTCAKVEKGHTQSVWAFDARTGRVSGWRVCLAARVLDLQLTRTGAAALAPKWICSGFAATQAQ